MLPSTTIKTLSFIEGIRAQVLKGIDGLTEEEALRIPAGSRNSIHWNVGHVLHVQLGHWYIRRGQPLPIDLGGPKYFKTGKSPLDYDAGIPSFALLLATYKEYASGLAEKFGPLLEEPLTQPFDFLGCHFATIADELLLLLFHDGEHLPIFQRLVKALGKG